MSMLPTWGKKCVQNIFITAKETTRKNMEEIKRNSAIGSWRNRFLEVKVGESV
jgi:hypothetical protein